MKIVLDTDVLVGGVLSPHGAPAAILRALLSGRARLCYDERILSRYREALTGEALGFDEHDVGEVLGYLKASGERVLSEPATLNVPNPDKAVFVEVARAARAEFLAADSAQDFPEHVGEGCRVVGASELVAQLA